MNVTRAVLPVMRKQRSGLLLTISSTAGIAGGMFCTAYAAAKFGVEGWMESLAPEIAPFGIRTMLVEPGFFRTELLDRRLHDLRRSRPSTTTPSAPGKPSPPGAAWTASKAATPPSSPSAIVQLAGLEEPPARFAAGADAVQTFEAKAKALLAQADAHRELSSSLAHDECLTSRTTPEIDHS